MTGSSDASPQVTMQQSKSTSAQSRPATFNDQVQLLDFTGDAIDMALRKLLSKVELPKEAQQIDRAMEDFAKRYHECNPDLNDTADAVYAVAFSVLLLHTDAHNKNVRQKMNKDTFIMRTKIIVGGENVPSETLDIMYDNIVSTQFTYAEGDDDIAKPRAVERSTSWLGRLARSDSGSGLASASMIEDFYPKLAQIMPPENTIFYKRDHRPVNITEAHMAFHNAVPLKLGGVRSNHSKFHHESTYTIRVAKAAVLERKYDMLPGGKKATARGWRPFGVILSGSQVIFFSDISAFESWLAEDKQYRQHQGTTGLSSSTIDSNVNASFTSQQSLAAATSTITSTNMTIPFMTPISSTLLRPVQIVSLANAVCIYDESYTKYPHVFRLTTGDGQTFFLRAKNDSELDNWMLKINYAATSKTTDVRLRPPRHSRSLSERSKREDMIKTNIVTLSQRLIECEKSLKKDLQLRQNLVALVPLQKSSRDRILFFAEILGKHIQTKRLIMQQLECYREFLEVALLSGTLRKMSAPLQMPLSASAITGKEAEMRPRGHEAPVRSATSPLLLSVQQDPCSTPTSASLVSLVEGETGQWDEEDHKVLSEAEEERRTTNATARRSSCPQVPPFLFAVTPATGGTPGDQPSSTAGPDDIEDDNSCPKQEKKDKNVAFDVPFPAPLPSASASASASTDNQQNKKTTPKWMRRRSNSNPVKFGRARSSSEASSMRDDDELTIVNVINGDDVVVEEEYDDDDDDDDDENNSGDVEARLEKWAL